MPCMCGAVAPDDFVPRLDVPADVLLWPEHQVEHAFDAPERAGVVPRRVGDLRSGADHDLERRRRLPWLLEEDVERHLDASVRRDRRHADLQFQPVLDRRDLEREGSPEMSGLPRLPIGRRADFVDDRVILRCRSPGASPERERSSRRRRTALPPDTRQESSWPLLMNSSQSWW